MEISLSLLETASQQMLLAFKHITYCLFAVEKKGKKYKLFLSSRPET